jgi:hypothetical protein
MPQLHNSLRGGTTRQEWMEVVLVLLPEAVPPVTPDPALDLDPVLAPWSKSPADG